MISPRRWALAGALLATSVAAGWTAVRDDEGSIAPARTPTRTMPPATAAGSRPVPPALRMAMMDRPSVPPVERDPFGAGPRVASAKRRPDGPAAAPAVPFTYAGRYETGGEQAVFLSAGERNLVVREGDVVERDWRVERIDATGIALTYLPRGQRFMLAIPDSPQ